MVKLRPATIEDRTALISLLQEAGMEYTEPPEAYTLALDDDAIAGCGRMEDHHDFMMVRPLVIASAYRRKGIGRLIMKNILHGSKPTLLVARSEAVAFYKSIGFSHTSWQKIPSFQLPELSMQ